MCHHHQTTSAGTTGGSAALQGELWSARADDWAKLQEPRQQPLFAAVLRRTTIGPGKKVLDVGCGSGVFCRLGADRGANVAGLDAAAGMIEIARQRVPEGTFQVGDMQFLPYPEHAFDVVCGFTSFQLAANQVAALAEARRVTKPGGQVVIVAWGRRERCELMTLADAWRALLPAPPAPASAPSSAPAPQQTVEEMAVAAGLTPATSGDLVTAWEYPEAATAARAILSSGQGTILVREFGPELVRATLSAALTPYWTDTGSYRLTNEWHYLIAIA